MSLSKLFGQDYISIDIETSDRDVRRGKIWSIGIKPNGKAGVEQFFSPEEGHLTPEQIASYKQELLSNKFGQQQEARGSFQPLFQALTNQTALPQAAVTDTLRDHITNSKFILIQNAFFENKFLTDHAARYEQLDHMNNLMEFRSSFTGSSAGFLYTPPSVTTHRSRGAAAYESFLNRSWGGTSEAFESTVHHYTSMMSSYLSEVNKAQKSIVVDLMDITKATYAVAASNNLIAKRNIHVGLSVEFLAQHVLGGEKETHTALSDAEKQERIAIKLSKMYDEIHSGTISDDTRKVFKSISAAQPAENALQFIKSLKSGLEESLVDEGYKIPVQRQFKVINAIVNSRNEPQRVTVYRDPMDKDSQKLWRTRDANVVTESIVEQAKNRLEISNEFIEDVLQKVSKHNTTEEKVSFLYDLEQSYKNGAEIPTGEQSGNWFSRIPKGVKIAAGVGAGLYALSEMTNDSNAKNKISEVKRRKEYKERTYDLDSNIRLYSRLDNYHGSGFATWNERTKHHEY